MTTTDFSWPIFLKKTITIKCTVESQFSLNMVEGETIVKSPNSQVHNLLQAGWRKHALDMNLNIWPATLLLLRLKMLRTTYWFLPRLPCLPRFFNRHLTLYRCIWWSWLYLRNAEPLRIVFDWWFDEGTLAILLPAWLSVCTAAGFQRLF